MNTWTKIPRGHDYGCGCCAEESCFRCPVMREGSEDENEEEAEEE